MAVIDTTDNIALCNQALGLLGAKEISSGGSSNNHGYCVTHFVQARDEILASHKWNFAKKAVYAIETTEPLFRWNNAFTKPSDCIRVWRIADDDQAAWEVVGGEIRTDEGDAPLAYSDDEVEYLAGQYITSDFTDEDLTYLVDEAFTSDDEETDLDSYCTSQGGDYKVLKVEYVYQYETPADWPVYVQTCFIYNLALKLCSPIKSAEAQTLALYQMLYGSKKTLSYLRQAKGWDAQESGGVRISTTKWINARR